MIKTLKIINITIFTVPVLISLVLLIDRMYRNHVCPHTLFCTMFNTQICNILYTPFYFPSIFGLICISITTIIIVILLLKKWNSVKNK